MEVSLGCSRHSTQYIAASEAKKAVICAGLVYIQPDSSAYTLNKTPGYVSTCMRAHFFLAVPRPFVM